MSTCWWRRSTACSRVSRHDQLRPVGSDWLFVKLYCPPAAQDEFLVGPMTAFCEGMRSSGLAQNWFFVRYKETLKERFRRDDIWLVSFGIPITYRSVG